MSQNRRLSQSFTQTHTDSFSSSIASVIAPIESDIWVENWKAFFARDIIDSRIVTVKAELSVEDACDKLLSEDIPCLAVLGNPESQGLKGLFDFSDVNAFLTLAATKHTFTPEDLRDKPRVQDIFLAAKAGHVPVHLVSNLSEKNPLEILPYDASIVSLLEPFARGVHRVLIRSSVPSQDFVGIVSDRRLLSWFESYAAENSSMKRFLSDPIRSFSFPSFNLYTAVVAATSKASVLEAMQLMSEEGVSSIAVLDDETGALLSAVSVTDIGKLVVPSSSNQILNIPLHQFISYIKAPEGSTDGAERFPVYSVSSNGTLFYTMQKLLATNAHRVFIANETPESSPIIASRCAGNLSGIVSIVDILSLFARLAHVQDVDPTRMRRHRRASSVSSQGSRSDRAEFNRSRSSSRTGIGRTSSISRSKVHNPRNSLSSSVESILGTESIKK
ncbi:cbs domain protein [Moniliophthora roreri MCA 2997]|uniref:Cbs domain protein n=1 Tax=Moniliophthora roreri (strain MCA 2997) TaxID=1381753 RepID=V2W866_MONRO|nr:cbs domain protein [Moniliophthora roreri MCA 2997]